MFTLTQSKKIYAHIHRLVFEYRLKILFWRNFTATRSDTRSPCRCGFCGSALTRIYEPFECFLTQTVNNGCEGSSWTDRFVLDNP